MRELRRFWVPAAALSAALVTVVLFRPIPFGPALRIWLVGMGALATSAVVNAALAPYARVEIAPLWRRRPPSTSKERPRGLAEWERAVDFAAWNATDFQRRLRPLLRQLASDRLRDRRGIDLNRQPAAGRSLLGERAWALFGEGHGAETKSGPAGLDAAAIQEAVVRLEQL